MSNQPHLNMPIPERMSAGIKYLIEQGEFATQAEYVRHLIRADLPRRIAARENDRIVLERLEQARAGARSCAMRTSQDDPTAAEARADAIIEGVERILIPFPEIGRTGRWSETRELVIPPYVMAYQITENVI